MATRWDEVGARPNWIDLINPTLEWYTALLNIIQFIHTQTDQTKSIQRHIDCKHHIFRCIDSLIR